MIRMWPFETTVCDEQKGASDAVHYALTIFEASHRNTSLTGRPPCRLLLGWE